MLYITQVCICGDRSQFWSISPTTNRWHWHFHLRSHRMSLLSLPHRMRMVKAYLWLCPFFLPKIKSMSVLLLTATPCGLLNHIHYNIGSYPYAMGSNQHHISYPSRDLLNNPYPYTPNSQMECDDWWERL